MLIVALGVTAGGIRIGFSRALLAQDEAEIAADRQKFDAAKKFRTSLGNQRVGDELSQAENEVAEARTTYNDALQKYNTDRERFPNNLAAKLFGFQSKNSYITAD